MATPLTANRIIEALKRWGIEPVELDGWRTHNRNSAGSFSNVNGIMIHGTGDGARVALDKQPAYMRNILFKGHGGLPGPLCHFGVGTDGTVYMIGWGRANHAGRIDGQALNHVILGTLPMDRNFKPGSDTIDGNSRLYGIEAVQALNDPLTPVQIDVIVKICAAISEAHGWGGADSLAHKESTKRKPNDPPSLNLGHTREAIVAAVKNGPTIVAPAPAPDPAPAPNHPEVDGRIGDRWRELGGVNSILGAPAGKEYVTKTGAFRAFQHGFMIWSLDTDARPNLGAIRERYADYGFENGLLGYPITDINDARNGGKWQGFERGSIYHHVDAGAHAVYGRIGEVWGDLRFENGPLGYPTSDEFEGAKPGRVQRFQGGTVYHSGRGTFPVWGRILEEYARKGWESGDLGYPVSAEVSEPSAWIQEFEGGIIRVPKPGVALPRAVVPAKVNPVPGSWISAVFGQRPKNNTYWQAKGYHTGRDYAAGYGAPVLAVVSGTVIARDDAVLGHIAILIGDNGRRYWYCHLKKGSRMVGRCTPGKQIGQVWDSGTGANGSHLHLEDSASSTSWGVGLRDPRW